MNTEVGRRGGEDKEKERTKKIKNTKPKSCKKARAGSHQCPKFWPHLLDWESDQKGELLKNKTNKWKNKAGLKWTQFCQAPCHQIERDLITVSALPETES